MRIYLAGGETTAVWMAKQIRGGAITKDAPELGLTSPIHRLVSYLYLRKMDTQLPPRAMEYMRGRSLLVDSGAHSFFAASKTLVGCPLPKRGTSVGEPEAYMAAYADWVEANFDAADYFVELDIQDLVGYPTVLRWRRMLKARGLWRKMVPVYHAVNTWDEFKEMVDNAESRYVGTEGRRSNRAPLPYKEMARYCYDQGCRLHGFAMVRSDVMTSIPFYSVDSSSWTYLWRHGAKAITFDGGSFISKQGKIRATAKQWRVKDERGPLLHTLHKLLNTHGVTPERAMAKIDVTAAGIHDMWRRTKQAVDAYAELEKTVTELWKRRGVDWAAAVGDKEP